MKLVPLADRIILQAVKSEEETTKSGIVLPGQQKEKPNEGVVVAVGPGGMVNGNEVEMVVKVGQHVLYSQYSGTEVEFEDEKYLICRQSEIMAVIE